MPMSIKPLLIGSTEAYSGKSAVILGLAYHLQNRGLDLAYTKPLGTCLSESPTDNTEEDVRFIAESLNLSDGRLRSPLFLLDEATLIRRISGEDQTDYQQLLKQTLGSLTGDLVLLEGPGTLDEGELFDLSIPKMAQAVEASVLLVCRYHSSLVVDGLLMAKKRLGDRLLGVMLNDVLPEHHDTIQTHIIPFLEHHGIRVFGLLPRNDLLRSVSVAELVHQLGAEVLCRPDRLDLMVESLKIGAMNVNSALKYFRKARNMAVVTGGDRTDIQLAALETSTQCLILTGQIPPSPTIVSRAEDLEIPILSVDLDTLTTVEIIDRTFGQVRLHEPIKVQCIRHLMEKHVDLDKLLASLELGTVTRA